MPRLLTGMRQLCEPAWQLCSLMTDAVLALPWGLLLLTCWWAPSHAMCLLHPLLRTPPCPQSISHACRLQSLASAVMTLVDAIVKTSQGQLKQSSSVLQEIMTAAADERGEWHVPLTSQQLESMSQVGAGWGAHCFAMLVAAASWEVCCFAVCSAHAGRRVLASAPLPASGHRAAHAGPRQITSSVSKATKTCHSSAGPAWFQLGRTCALCACCAVLAVTWLGDLASRRCHLTP